MSSSTCRTTPEVATPLIAEEDDFEPLSWEEANPAFVIDSRGDHSNDTVIVHMPGGSRVSSEGRLESMPFGGLPAESVFGGYSKRDPVEEVLPDEVHPCIIDHAGQHEMEYDNTNVTTAFEQDGAAAIASRGGGTSSITTSSNIFIFHPHDNTHRAENQQHNPYGFAGGLKSVDGFVQRDRVFGDCHRLGNGIHEAGANVDRGDNNNNNNNNNNVAATVQGKISGTKARRQEHEGEDDVFAMALGGRVDFLRQDDSFLRRSPSDSCIPNLTGMDNDDDYAFAYNNRSLSY